MALHFFSFLGLCLVNHESGFQYDIVHENSDGSKDYGIYQLNDNYWCDQGDTKYSSCWQINTFGCGYQCSGESQLINPIQTGRVFQFPVARFFFPDV